MQCERRSPGLSALARSRLVSPSWRQAAAGAGAAAAPPRRTSGARGVRGHASDGDRQRAAVARSGPRDRHDVGVRRPEHEHADRLPRPGARPEAGARAREELGRRRDKNITLHLRNDVKWTDGTTVTADDVVWSWLRTISPQLGADYAYQFYGISGAQEYNSCKPSAANQQCDALKDKVAISGAGRDDGEDRADIAAAVVHAAALAHLVHPGEQGCRRQVGREVDRAGPQRQRRPVHADPVEARRVTDAREEPRLVRRVAR